jgi:hypothetical protein
VALRFLPENDARTREVRVERVGGTVKPPNLVGEIHLHSNRKSATFIARMVRQPLYPVAQGDVDAAIGWLDEHWLGGVFVPDDLMPLVAVA